MAKEKRDLVNFSPLELVDVIINSGDDYKTFLRVPTEKKGLVFLNLPHSIRVKFSQIMKPTRVAKILKYLDQVDIVDFLEVFDNDKKDRILSLLNKSQKEKIQYLLQFDSESAAGLMNTNFVIIDKNNFDYDKIRKKIEWHVKRSNQPPLVIVRDSNFITGYIPFMSFILSEPKQIDDIVKSVPMKHYNDKYEDIIDDVLEDNDYIIVTDDDNSLLGFIELDTLLKLAEKKNQEEVYKFAGVSKEEDIFDDIITKVKSRYLWLILNLFTAFLAAGVIGFFEDTLSALVLLAVYLPVIAGMGGNAATQTLAVVIRGLAVHDIDRGKKIRIILNEVGAGFINGLINGVLVGIAAYLFNGMYLLGIVVFLSMVANLIIAGFFGTLVPFVLKKYKLDPATGATVFVTTATDLFGFFIFLGLAKLMLF